MLGHQIYLDLCQWHWCLCWASWGNKPGKGIRIWWTLLPSDLPPSLSQSALLPLMQGLPSPPPLCLKGFASSPQTAEDNGCYCDSGWQCAGGGVVDHSAVPCWASGHLPPFSPLGMPLAAGTQTQLLTTSSSFSLRVGPYSFCGSCMYSQSLPPICGSCIPSVHSACTYLYEL